MNGALRDMTWNANGLLKHQEELIIGLENDKIYISLISKIHPHYFQKLQCLSHNPPYQLCERRYNINHYEDGKTMNRPLLITAIYCPLR